MTIEDEDKLESQLKLAKISQEDFNRLVVESLHELLQYKYEEHYSTTTNFLYHRIKILKELFDKYQGPIE